MKSLFLLSGLLISLWVAVHGQQDFLPTTVSEFIDKQEEVVQEIAAAATDLHARRVNLVRNCECSKHSCSSDFPSSTTSCATYLGTPSICESEGRLLDNSSSIVFTPSGVNPEDLGTNVIESICIYKQLDDVFESLTSEEAGWMFLGTRDGHARIFPATPGERGDNPEEMPFNDCAPFDPRVRPWYISAATGPKDIVLVVDKSGSMNEPLDESGRTKWNLTVGAVNAILDTFTFADFVNVVTFSDEAEPLWKESGLARGRRSSLDALKENLSRESPKGSTNFTAAFTTAFGLLTENCNAEPKSCSNCQKVIFFLTDGFDTSEEEGGGESIQPSEMVALVDDLQTQLLNRSRTSATIFTYSISTSGSDAIPRQIACANNGAWSLIQSGSSALDALNSYSLYLAAGRKFTTPIWIEPYEDFSGLGNVTTVALSVYATGTENVPDVFLGVAGRDVPLGELEMSGVSHEEVLNAIIDRSERCTVSRLSQCDLQAFRNAQDARSLCPDSYPTTPRSSRSRNRRRAVAQCYEFRSSFYKRFSNGVSWDSAVEACEEDGGELVSVVDEKELAFAANLASADGSWVGARGTQSNRFSWRDRTVDRLATDSPYWGVGEPSVVTDSDQCVAIDTRGTVGNLQTRPCRDALSFICKYESDESCDGQISELPRRGYFAVPPLDSCIGVEILDETLPVDDAAKLNASQVICDLGEPISSKEAICCDSSGVDARSRRWRSPRSMPLSLVAVAFATAAVFLGQYV